MLDFFIVAIVLYYMLVLFFIGGGWYKTKSGILFDLLIPFGGIIRIIVNEYKKAE